MSEKSKERDERQAATSKCAEMVEQCFKWAVQSAPKKDAERRGRDAH